jgi:hypothetical protein
MNSSFFSHIWMGRHRAATVAQHVLESIAQPITVGTLSFSLPPSIGISYYLEDDPDVSGLVYTADLALYLAKQNGRGNYQFYIPELEARAEEVYALEACLKKALKDGGFAPVLSTCGGYQDRQINQCRSLGALDRCRGQGDQPATFHSDR